MLQRYAAATYVGRMCPATIADKIRGKTRHSGTYLYTKGRSWGGCIYIYIILYGFTNKHVDTHLNFNTNNLISTAAYPYYISFIS
jgi:hypothetical protein